MPAKIYVGIKAAIFKAKKLLVLRRELVGGEFFWDLPGGRLEADEDIPVGLKRELAEELPALLNYELGELLGARKKLGRISDGTELLMLYYQVFTPEFEPKLSPEHSTFAWMDQSDLASLPDPYSQTYARLFERAKL